MAIREFYWYEGKDGKCPFDSFLLGKPVPNFKSDDGKVRLNIQKCPLCHKTFVEFRPDLDCLRYNSNDNDQYISCRFLDPRTKTIQQRQRKEEKNNANRYEPSPADFHKYRLLISKYDISEKWFCECFDADIEEYRYFADNYRNIGDKLLPLKAALISSGISQEVRRQMKDYEQLQKEKTRAEEIILYFKTRFRDEEGNAFLLDNEQALAVALDSEYILTQARAGSGKTRALSSKIVYLIEHEHYSEDSILALAFNTDVPKSINGRTGELLKQHSFLPEGSKVNIAKTFHKVARDIVRPRGEIIAGYDRTALIQAVISDLQARNPWFKYKVYEAFKKESFQVGGKDFSDEESLYFYIRGAQHETLNGETVKSLGEKWIADYLFEHGIKYEYEPAYYPSYIQSSCFSDELEGATIKQFLDQNAVSENGRTKRRTIKPDFLLSDYNLVWEHWGIDESNPPKDKKALWAEGMSWQEYFERMQWKRCFWSAKWRKGLYKKILINTPSKAQFHLNRIASIDGLIETSVIDMNQGREQFESTLSSALDALGVSHNRRNQDEIVEEAWEKQIKRFTKMMETFIDKYEQKYPGNKYREFKELLSRQESSERSSDFLKLACLVLRRYQKILRTSKKPKRFAPFSKYLCDFDMLLADATDTIENGNADTSIKKIKYLLIDEYQDFSDLFYGFIQSIIKRNPSINVFCVGDNWQAINRFMGADTYYYDHFGDCFPSARFVNINTNYRCEQNIINSSNYFMKASGYKEAPAVGHKPGMGNVTVYNTNDVFLAMREEYPSYEEDSKLLTFFSTDRSVSLDIARYLKMIVQIIQWYKGQEILILNRTQRFAGHYELTVLKSCLNRFMKNEYNFTDDELENVSVMTMHASKGLEADVVILLECNEGMLPKIHPDNELYYIFGESPKLNYKDEEKLFYVALTRAKRSVFLLYDQNPSPFLKVLKAGKACSGMRVSW